MARGPCQFPTALIAEGRAALAAGRLGRGAARCSPRRWSGRTHPRPVTGSPGGGVGRGLRAAVRLYERAFAGYRARGEMRLPALIAGRELELPARGRLRERRGRGRVAGAGPEPGRRGGGVPGDAAGWSSPRRWRPTTRTRSTRTRRRRPGSRAGPATRTCSSARSATRATSLVLRGRVAEGMRRVDEAALAATTGEVRDHLVVGEIYCKMLLCCELALDVRRAQEWIDVADARAARPTTCGSRRSAGCTTAGS